MNVFKFEHEPGHPSGFTGSIEKKNRVLQRLQGGMDTAPFFTFFFLAWPGVMTPGVHYHDALLHHYTMQFIQLRTLSSCHHISWFMTMQATRHATLSKPTLFFFALTFLILILLCFVFPPFYSLAHLSFPTYLHRGFLPLKNKMAYFIYLYYSCLSVWLSNLG